MAASTAALLPTLHSTYVTPVGDGRVDVEAEDGVAGVSEHLGGGVADPGGGSGDDDDAGRGFSHARTLLAHWTFYRDSPPETLKDA